MAASPIQIYAELLPNIRQVSVYVTLPSTADESTVAEVLADGLTLRVRHGGLLQELRLPGVVAAAGSRLPTIVSPQKQQQQQRLQKVSKKEEGMHGHASWRLPLAGRNRALAPDGHDAAEAEEAATLASATNELAAPWSAGDLRANTPVSCRACRAQLVAAESISVWKDLPSDNWAEMMEFWHCHKPDDHHDHQHGGGRADAGADAQENGKATSENLAARGYGANSIISAQAGVGFVDLIALVFAEGDCGGIVFSESAFEKGSRNRQSIETEPSQSKSQLESLNIFCASCRAQIGYFNFRMQSVTLFKWQVQCDAETTVQPALSECLSATLMATISRSGSSKSLVMPIYDLLALPGPPPEAKDGASAAEILHVWVLNSNIRYASSRQRAPVPAVKLLYKFIQKAEADAILEKLNSDVQEINLPGESIQAVVGMLEESNSVLPAKERQFKEWKIGLLKRWEPIAD